MLALISEVEHQLGVATRFAKELRAYLGVHVVGPAEKPEQHVA